MNSNKFLEEVINKIKITADRQKYIRQCVKNVFDRFSEIVPLCHNYRFGGGFKRYTSIRNYFDVDVYFIGNYQKQNLLNYFKNRLKELQKQYIPFKIAKSPPYLHAIN